MSFYSQIGTSELQLKLKQTQLARDSAVAQAENFLQQRLRLEERITALVWGGK
jgi:hypothetical protein